MKQILFLCNNGKMNNIWENFESIFSRVYSVFLTYNSTIKLEQQVLVPACSLQKQNRGGACTLLWENVCTERILCLIIYQCVIWFDINKN